MGERSHEIEVIARYGLISYWSFSVHLLAGVRRAVVQPQYGRTRQDARSRLAERRRDSHSTV